MLAGVIVCQMCNLPFRGRTGAQTCSPRCRKRRERCMKGQLPGTRIRMGEPPNPKASALWR